MATEIINNLIIGVSTVADGNMSTNWGEDAIVKSNRDRFLKKNEIKPEDIVMASLEKKTNIRVVDEKDKGKFIECDALITLKSELGLMMTVGDCFPVVIYDPAIMVLGLVHLGYQGTDGRLAEKAVKKFVELGSKPEDLKVWVGPGIRKESYIWESDVVVQKDDPLWLPFLEHSNGMTHIDILGYIRKQLLDSGVKSENIEDCGIDTGIDPNYFSHYRSKRTGDVEGRFAVVAMIKEMNGI